MSDKSTITQICKTIISIVLIIAWVFIFCFLLLMGPPIWGVLLLILTTICLITYFRKSNKNSNKKIDELEKRIENLEKDR